MVIADPAVVVELVAILELAAKAVTTTSPETLVPVVAVAVAQDQTGLDQAAVVASTCMVKAQAVLVARLRVEVEAETAVVVFTTCATPSAARKVSRGLFTVAVGLQTAAQDTRRVPVLFA